MKVLVTGGRKYNNYDLVNSTLSEISPTSVVEGGATGADELARRWCKETGTTHFRHNAKWKELGTKAGPARNKEMLKLHPDIDLVLAFPGGKGTADMVEQASKAGIDIRVITEPPSITKYCVFDYESHHEWALDIFHPDFRLLSCDFLF